MPRLTAAQKTKQRKAEQAETRKQFRRRRMLAEVRSEAREFAAENVDRGVDPAEAVQQILDELASAWQYATSKALTLTEDEYFEETMGIKRPHAWIQEQERLGLQVVHVAAKAAGMGLAERQVRIQEQQAAIFGTVVEFALTQIGLGMEERRKVHSLIAARLDDIQTTAEELPAVAA